MKPTHYIQRNWRLLCTSLALMLVLTVNHRALPAYAHAAPAPEQTAWQKGRDADASVVKQKISFEATTSVLDLTLAHQSLVPVIAFVAPVPQAIEMPQGIPYWTFFLQQQATLPISPNAP